jgi:hypothetical protein
VRGGTSDIKVPTFWGSSPFESKNTDDGKMKSALQQEKEARKVLTVASIV